MTFSIIDLIVQRSCALNPAVAMLRKRLLALEELRLDEEVASYTSAPDPDAPGCLRPRPRCGNPLASILLSKESSVSTPPTVCRKISINGVLGCIFYIKSLTC